MVTKKTVAKKPVKKAIKKLVKKPIKKTALKRTASNRVAAMKSFQLYKDAQPFTSVRLTRQTFYWVILMAFIVLTQLWILKIQMDIVNITSLLIIQ